MAECQQNDADDPVFSIDLASCFDGNITELNEIDDNELPDEILCQFSGISLEQNPAKNQNSMNAAAANVDNLTANTNRFEILTSEQVDEIAYKEIVDNLRL